MLRYTTIAALGEAREPEGAGNCMITTHAVLLYKLSRPFHFDFLRRTILTGNGSKTTNRIIYSSPFVGKITGRCYGKFRDHRYTCRGNPVGDCFTHGPDFPGNRGAQSTWRRGEPVRVGYLNRSSCGKMLGNHHKSSYSTCNLLAGLPAHFFVGGLGKALHAAEIPPRGTAHWVNSFPVHVF